jgi:flagellar FliJ protein
MKSRDTLVRLKRFQVDEKRRRIVQLNAMLAEFTRMSGELDREIANEEQRANIDDPNHFAYPTYARAARVRRDNMIASIQELRGQLEEVEAMYEEAKAELAKAQGQEMRDRSTERLVDIVAERRASEAANAARSA